jgi:RHS repeat-associated protein
VDTNDSSVSPAYDDDGLTDDGTFTYAWNGENCLVTVTPKTPAVGDKKLDVLYDHMGRRVRKITTAWDGAAWQPDDTALFVYNGWNLIEELAGAVTASYVHGLDLSQSLQGAGGIGGILARVDHGADKTHIYFYDANGNVGQLIDSADGSIVAAYEYAPFGGIISAMGSYAGSNPFRFSSKYADDVTGLYYYGFRYYSPVLGRWVSRDPIGEDGGVNLYAFVGNNPVNTVDFQGMTSLTHVDQGIVFYTWHMGWIDTGHAYGENKSLAEAWRKIKKTRAGAVISFELSMSQSGKRSYAKFCISPKSDLTAKKEQLLYAWMSISEQFEGYQNKGPQGSSFINRLYGMYVTNEVDKIPSGFSTEDLVSNLVHFYAIVDSKSAQDLLNNYAGRFDISVERMISRAIWLHSMKPQPSTAGWEPTYFDHQGFLQINFGPAPDIRAVHYNNDKENAKKVQSLIRSYWNKFGEPTFPSYFKKYAPTSEQLIMIDKNDI